MHESACEASRRAAHPAYGLGRRRPAGLATVLIAGTAAVLALALPGGAVDSHPVLGANVPRVEAVLGHATRVERFPHRRDLSYGTGGRLRFEVIFSGPDADPSGQRAWAVLIDDPRVVVPGVGPALALPPHELEARLRAAFAGRLRRGRRYRCDAKGCFGTFFSLDGRRRVIFGLSRGRRYIGVQVWPSPR